MIVKLLGAIDIAGAVSFLLILFGMPVFIQFTLFCAGLLLLKGMFILTGDVLSVVDIFASAALILSLFFTLPSLMIWIPLFLLLAKGVVSFF